MQIDQITNTGIRNLQMEIADNLIKWSSFDIGSAFINQKSIQLLDIFFKKNNNRFRSGRLLIGLMNRFNKKSDIKRLKELEKKYAGIFEVRISRYKNFHWKYYFFTDRQRSTVYIGSANFTAWGLTSTGEYLLKMNAASSKLKNFRKSFEFIWNDSIPIKLFPVELYKEIPHAIAKGNSLHPTIEKLLRRTNPPKDSVTANHNARIAFTNSFLTAKSEKALLDFRSNWDKWLYFTCFSLNDFEHFIVGQKILNIFKDKGKYHLSWGIVMDTCILKTPDGKYFVAYKNKGKTKTETKKIRNVFLENGIDYHKRSFKNRNIPKFKLDKINLIFKYPN